MNTMIPTGLNWTVLFEVLSDDICCILGLYKQNWIELNLCPDRNLVKCFCHDEGCEVWDVSPPQHLISPHPFHKYCVIRQCWYKSTEEELLKHRRRRTVLGSVAGCRHMVGCVSLENRIESRLDAPGSVCSDLAELVLMLSSVWVVRCCSGMEAHLHRWGQWGLHHLPNLMSSSQSEAEAW